MWEMIANISPAKSTQIHI